MQGADAILKKKEAEMHALAVRMEDEKVCDLDLRYMVLGRLAN